MRQQRPLKRLKTWGTVGALALAASGAACFALADIGAGYRWALPPGVAPPAVPADNPMSQVKVELGRRLFYDADLSVDGTVACATCHEQRRAFTEGNRTHGGVQGNPGRRNVMALANVGYFRPLTSGDPGVVGLESQVLVPLMGDHPVEMGMAGQGRALIDRLGGQPCYPQQFAAAFPQDGGRITVAATAKAIAAFERTLTSFDSPYDRYRRGDRQALSAQARRGEALFKGRLNCSGCHSGPNFTDADRAAGEPAASFHNIGLYDRDGAGGYPASDRGLVELTGKAADEGRFRTPSLRNVALTGPYMHDGSVAGLREAVARHYGFADVRPNPLRDPRLSGRIGTDELDQVTAFLATLTDRTFVARPSLGLPKPPRCDGRTD